MMGIGSFNSNNSLSDSFSSENFQLMSPDDTHINNQIEKNEKNCTISGDKRKRKIQPIRTSFLGTKLQI